MPQNFRFIPLICAALPEAKIIHVSRDPSATCWSNYRQYFAARNLGYCYSVKDIVEYYKLYNNLMKIWQGCYSDQIYNLDYDKLTIDQSYEIKRLIEHLNLKWEETCLFPQKNKRGVKTASQQQIRQKIYKGSSKLWQKYQPFLTGALDNLTS